MKRYTLLYFIALALLMAACTDDIANNGGGQDKAMPIDISSNYPTQATTRASMENGFIDGDAVGIFVVDYDTDGTAGTPELKGERAGNIRFSYDGSRWTANYQLYWKNKNTPADFYGYYPYDPQMQSVTEYAFAISRRQDCNNENTSTAGYEASDLLWAKTTNVQPTTEAISLQYKHLMAGITVSLQMGTGFENEEWAALDKTVQIENTILNGSVDLSTGTAIVGSGSTTPIIPLPYNGSWRAIVYPQTVDAGKTIASITIDGQAYQLAKDIATTYLSGKMHNMTITVDRSNTTGQYTCTLSADDIVAWVDDPNLHDGLTIQYTILRTKSPGTLKQVADSIGIAYDELRNVKFEGPINDADLHFIYEYLGNVECVNMAKAEIVDGGLWGFGEKRHTKLRHFVFPEHGVKTIGSGAFSWTALSGTIVIPEGVESIEFGAFADIHTGSNYVVLPSTIKTISGSFIYGDWHADSRLPEGIVMLDNPAITFEGTMYLPSSLEVISRIGSPKQTGTIVIPPKITEIPAFTFSGSGCTQVEFHDGITEIGANAFGGSKLTGELVLPPNLKVLDKYAFGSTRITKIIFPDNLRIMRSFQDEGVFANCTYLTGTVELPKHVAVIPCGCFMRCTAITGLVIPEGVDIIEELAFKDCYSINSIVVQDENPPVIMENTFQGVPKDNFTVEVPKGCVEKYREAPGWKEFKRIAEYSNFVCRPMQANALNTAHTEQLVLNADGPWTVTKKPDWVTLSRTSGTGKAELTLTFQQMAHGAGNRSDTIRFAMTTEGHETFCVVSQYDYEHEEDSHIALQTHTKGRGIDIVFIGDGYDGEDIANGNYLSLVKQQTEHFFDLEPYKSHHDYFNVYVTFPLSQEKGVNTMNTYVNNHFGTLYGYDGTCTSNQLLTEVSDVRDYAVEHTPLTQDGLGRSLIILVPNSDAYSGVTYFEWYGSPISICPPSSRPYPQDTRGVVQHEAGGHGFGRLGDEEIVYSLWAPSSVKNEIEDKHRNGEYANLATTSGLHSVPWADFVFDTRYSDQVDVFEGGLNYMRGVFRPEQNSCMNYGIPYYNAPSRLSIMRRIFSYAGEHFSMEYFYKHDSKAWGSTGTETRSGMGGLSGSSYAASNQHRQPQTIDGKAMTRSVKRIREHLKKNNQLIRPQAH